MQEIRKTDSGFEDTNFAKAHITEFIDLLKPFKGHWVQFRRDDDFGLSDEYSNEITPHAIYGLDVDRLIIMAEGQLLARSPNQTMFHYIGFNRRPVAAIFEMTGTIVTAASYKDYATHWERLMHYLDERHPGATSRVQGYYPRDHYVDSTAISAILYATEHACDYILGLTGDGPYRPHPNKPRLWRKLLLSAGIDAVEDRLNQLTGDCDHQIVALNPEKAMLISILENPLANDAKPILKMP